MKSAGEYKNIELYQILDGIDKYKYPERYEEIRSELDQRKNNGQVNSLEIDSIKWQELNISLLDIRYFGIVQLLLTVYATISLGIEISNIFSSGLMLNITPLLVLYLFVLASLLLGSIIMITKNYKGAYLSIPAYLIQLFAITTSSIAYKMFIGVGAFVNFSTPFEISFLFIIDNVQLNLLDFTKDSEFTIGINLIAFFLGGFLVAVVSQKNKH